MPRQFDLAHAKDKDWFIKHKEKNTYFTRVRSIFIRLKPRISIELPSKLTMTLVRQLDVFKCSYIEVLLLVMLIGESMLPFRSSQKHKHWRMYNYSLLLIL